DHPDLHSFPTRRSSDLAGALLCVAAVIHGKGHDVLLDALATVPDLPWQCLCAGRLDRDPAFVEGLRRRVLDRDLADRVSFPGPRSEEHTSELQSRFDLV